MYKADVINYFKSAKNVAKELGIFPSAVSMWEKVIPIERAKQINKLVQTKRIQKKYEASRPEFDPKLYEVKK